MIDYKNIIGNQEDWANMVTNVESAQAPFVDWLPVDGRPVNALYDYQAELYADPERNSHVDGTPVTGFKSAGDGRARLKALIQYFTKAVAIKKLHQDVTNIAGIPDEMARDINKRTVELSRDFEAAFLSDDDGVEDNGVVGYSTRGVGSWISSAAQTLYPVDPNFRPPAASISTVNTATLTENHILDILESVGGVLKESKPITAFCGPKGKRLFNAMPLFIPSSTLVAGTGATGVVYNKEGVANVGRVVETYMSDFGVVELRISWRNLFFNSNAVTRNNTVYFLHRDMWELRWNQKPAWMRKEYQGGAFEAFCEAIVMLVCKNPKGEAKWQPTA